MTKEQEISGLNKLVNSSLISFSFGKIEVSLSKNGSFLIYRFYIDKPISKKDLYDNIDVFWIIDHQIRGYITKLMPFDKIPILSNDYQVEIYNSYGIKIFDWLEDLQTMHEKNPNSMGGAQWYRMSKEI